MTQHPDPGRTYGYEPPRGPATSAAPDPANGEERTMMLIAHLSAPASMLLSAGWLPFLGPLLVWLFYRERSYPVRVASAGAFNFNITMTIASVVTWISVFITLGIGFLWAIPIWIVLFLIQVWAHVRGALAASRGEVYDYPFQIRLLS